MWQPLYFKLCERTVFGGDLLQTVVLCPGNANIRAQDSIFAVLEGRSDHMTRAGSPGGAWAGVITHKVGTGFVRVR